MRPEDLANRLRVRPLVLDGGLATELEAAGADTSGTLWSAQVLRDHPEAVIAAHQAFLAAGAEVLITASYQVSRRGLVAAGGTAREADSLLVRSVLLADEARTRAGRHGALVAASVGPWGATNHDGSEYRGRYGLPRRELAAFHRERLAPLVECGPDLLAVETIPDIVELEALAEVLDEQPLAAWVCVTTPDGRTLSDGTPLAEAAAVLAQSPAVVAVGINCSAPRHVAPALEELSAAGAGALVAYPNAGQVWDAATEEWGGPVDDAGTGLVREWQASGAVLVGGCCGVGPAEIAALAATLQP